MGQRTNGVGHARAADHLAHEIESIRRDLDGVIGELDRRRHELTDWRLQLRRHKRGVTWTLLGLAATVGGLVALRIWRQRRRDQPLSKIRRLRRALARMIDDPDAVAQRSPDPGRHVLAQAGGALASTFVKRAAR